MSIPAAGAARAAGIERVCRAPHDALSLRIALIAELRRAVGFDAHAWLLTDPVTEVGSAPFADVPCLPELPSLIRLKYLTEVNRWTGLDRPVARLLAATGGRPEDSLLWRELLHRYGVGDVASLVFRDRFGCWGFLDLWRAGAGTGFTDAEERFLAGVAEVITEALRRSQAMTFELAAGVAAPVPARGGPTVLVLSRRLEVRAQTPETAAYLRLLVPPDRDGRPVPAGAYNVAAQLLATEAGVDGHPAAARVHLAGGTWLTLRAAPIGGAGDVADIAVTIEPTPPHERLSLFARAHALSRRETDLLDQLAAGADTRQAAAVMVVSEHTVQDHLKSVFLKTGTRSRRTLLSRALGR